MEVPYTVKMAVNMYSKNIPFWSKRISLSSAQENQSHEKLFFIINILLKPLTSTRNSSK
jgi:hypothetical protein